MISFKKTLAIILKHWLNSILQLWLLGQIILLFTKEILIVYLQSKQYMWLTRTIFFTDLGSSYMFTWLKSFLLIELIHACQNFSFYKQYIKNTHLDIKLISNTCWEKY